MPFKTKEEKAEYDRKRYLARRELKLAYMRQYAKEHPEIKRNWRNNNRDKVNAQKREWRRKNRERVLELRKSYEKTERAKELQKIRREHWKQLNPLKYQETQLASCLRRKGKIGSGKIPKNILNRLLEDMTCGICGLVILDKYHIDHIIPVSKGGEHIIENLQLAHPLCNLRKGASTYRREVVYNST